MSKTSPSTSAGDSSPPSSPTGTEFIQDPQHGSVRRSNRHANKAVQYNSDQSEATLQRLEAAEDDAVVTENVEENAEVSVNQSSRKKTTRMTTKGKRTKQEETETEDAKSFNAKSNIKKVVGKRKTGENSENSGEAKRQRTMKAGAKTTEADTPKKTAAKGKPSSDVVQDDDPAGDVNFTGSDSAETSPLSSAETTPKTKGKQATNAKKVPKATQVPKVEAAGKPVVWAESRSALCETLPYYRAFQSGAYTTDGRAFGMLLAKDSAEQTYVDGEIVIARAGGHFAQDDSGISYQKEDQKSTNHQVKSFRTSMEKNITIVVILAKDNNVSNVEYPYNFNIVDHFHITEIWPERNKGKTCFRYRLQKLDLMKPSWWVAKGTPVRTELPDFTFCVPKFACSTCSKVSKQIFTNGSVCLNEDCPVFFKDDKGCDLPAERTYSEGFMKERTEWPQNIQPVYALQPSLLNVDSESAAAISYSWAAAKGMCCPQCGRCNSREFWDRWECRSCHFVHKIPQPVMSPLALIGMDEFQYTGHAIPTGEACYPAKIIFKDIVGQWRITTYELIKGNTVTHFQANKTIIDAEGGPTDVFSSIQRSGGMGLQRFPIGVMPAKDERLTSHFSINFGMHYKYVVAVRSRAFKEAPPLVLNAREMLEWAGKFVVGDKESTRFNELLAIGYYEKQKMNYHDDGEKELGPTVATLSLGGNATMCMRMKPLYWKGLSKTGAYYPDDRILPGALFVDERKALNKLHGKVSEAEFDQRRKAMYVQAAKRWAKKGKKNDSEDDPEEAPEDIDENVGKEDNEDGGKKQRRGFPKTPPDLVKMKLRHGDIVIMHGAEMQKYFEHAIFPTGNLRFGLTCRTVSPEKIDSNDHWKAEYDSASVPKYNGKSFDPPPATIVSNGDVAKAVSVVMDELIDQVAAA